MSILIRPFPRLTAAKRALPQPLRWVIRRARRLERFFHCTRSDAIREAATDYTFFTGKRPHIRAMKGARNGQ